MMFASMNIDIDFTRTVERLSEQAKELSEQVFTDEVNLSTQYSELHELTLRLL